MEMIIYSAALALLLTTAVRAEGVFCTAEQRCRADAPSMCAPSSMDIQLRRFGSGAQLWIDKQGPYQARLSIAEHTTRAELTAFGGYEFTLRPDGRFEYRGNAGKLFTGRCEGGL